MLMDVLLMAKNRGKTKGKAGSGSRLILCERLIKFYVVLIREMIPDASVRQRRGCDKCSETDNSVSRAL